MKMVNYKEAGNREVEEWLYNHIRELTTFQKEWIRNEEIVRFAPFKFVKRPETKTNVLWRLSVLVMPVVWVCLVIGLIFNYFFTGRWGYKTLNWYVNWRSKCGLN